MEGSDGFRLLTRQTGDTSIGRMRLQGHVGLPQPLMQSLGMHTKHPGTVFDRKQSHDQNSFAKQTAKQTRFPTLLGNVGEQRDL
jgi:hypothetical protein